MTSRQHMALGLLFLMVSMILGYYTFFKTDFSLFTEKVGMTVWFENAGGIRDGDPVLVAGVRWGEVDGLEYDAAPDDPRRRIKVELALNEEIGLFGDHAILIRDATVLGGKNLVIEPGTSASGAAPAGDLYGKVAPDVLSALGEVINENRDAIRNTLAGLETVVEGVNAGEGVLAALIHDSELRATLTSAVENVNGTFENLDAITNQIKSGEGSIAKLIYDDALYNQIDTLAQTIQTLADQANGVMTDIRAGKGTVGMLLYDEETSADVKQALDDIAALTKGLRAGEGTLGMLLSDEAFRADVDLIVRNIANGEGTLGKLINDPAVYEDVAAIAADLRSFSAALASGEGTISKLVYDDELYAQLDRSLRVLTGTLEEAREAAPISNFLNTLFLGF